MEGGLLGATPSSAMLFTKDCYSIVGSVFTKADNVIAGPILGLCPANERRRYKVTPSLIGWA